MSLGDAFPSSLVSASVQRQLAPGAVIKLRVRLDDGKEREKRLIVVSVDQGTVTCVINSEINPIIARNPAMLRCQVTISATHQFVDRDCFADCSRLRAFPTKDVLRQLTNNTTWFLGSITAGLRDQVIAAIKTSPTISVVDAAHCCECLSSVELEP